MQEDGIVSKDEDLKSELTGITLGSATYLLNDLKQTIIFFLPVLCIIVSCQVAMRNNFCFKLD